MDDSSSRSYRRMGAILVERGAITTDQLAEALETQSSTGRLLGEICVEQVGMDRFALADALSEQWDEMRLDGRPKTRGRSNSAGAAVPSAATVSAEELRALLDEAEAARAEFAAKTDELTQRLAVLETLVIGVSGALEDIRSADR